MTVIDEIKDRIDLVDFVSKYVQLEKSGHNYQGMCPFHDNKNTPAFSVDINKQKWRCWGVCNTSGDLLDFYQKMFQCDVHEAIAALAPMAGIALKPSSPEEQRGVDLRREREAILGAAMNFFQKRIQEGSPEGMDYAISRGWSKETIQGSGVGFFGKDWNGLRKHLQDANIDLGHPTAVALIGFQGDVTAWARKNGIPEADIDKDWIKNSKIPAMPPNMLIYPHLWRGKISVIAGRRLPEEGSTAPKSWNMPGPRRMMFNTLWWQPGEVKGRIYVVVEGQGDATTLGGWGIPAGALAGCSLSRASGNGAQPGADLHELVRVVKNGGKLVLGLDSDEAGDKALPAVAKALLDEGLTAVQVYTVRWPVHDVNDWLKEGGAKADDAQQLLDSAYTWIAHVIAKSRNDQEMQRETFSLLASLDLYDVERWRGPVMDAMEIRPRSFDAMLKAARRDKGLTEDGKPQYMFMGGATWYRTYDHQYGGEERLSRLAHFEAWIVKDVLRDDGIEVRRELHIDGKLGGKPLPTARVDANEFKTMNWPMRDWGSLAVIEAGRQTCDHLRAAIQLLSKDVARHTIYTHTGWRELPDGKRVYLTGAGAIGGDQIEVEMDRDLIRYQVPLQPDNPGEAMRLVLGLLDLARGEVVYPLFGACFVSILRSFVSQPFMIWMFGVTGSMKSTLAALFLNLFGEDFSEKHMPADFLDTGNRLEHKAHLVKDSVLIIDDFAPQSTRRSQLEYQAKAERIARAVGNQAGRGRMTSNGTAQSTYAPRAMVIATGEDLAGVEGVLARMFIVEVKRDDVRKNLNKLTEIQHQRDRLCHAMSGYIAWIASNWDGLKETLPQRQNYYRQQALAHNLHLRYPDAVSALQIGIEMGLRYAVHVGALKTEEFDVMRDTGWAALLNCVENMSEIARREKPEELFVQAVGNMITRGAIYLRPRSGEGDLLGGGESTATFVGWYDTASCDFVTGLIYTEVCKYYREQGITFPQSEEMLKKTLSEARYSIADPGRLEKQVQVWDSDGKKRDRFLQIRRDVIPLEIKP